jgi:hypothetical protein
MSLIPGGSKVLIDFISALEIGIFSSPIAQ